MRASLKNQKKYSPYLLPGSFDEMDSFIQSNKTLMTEQVLSSIEYALQEKLPVIEVFKFQKSNFVVTITFDTFLDNLKNIFDYYISTEKYELCKRVKLLESKINTVSFTDIQYEKK